MAEGFVENRSGWDELSLEILKERAPQAEAGVRRFTPVRSGELLASEQLTLGYDQDGAYFEISASRLNEHGVQVAWYIEAHESFLRAGVGLVAGGRSRQSRRAKKALKATRAARRARRQAAKSGEVAMTTVHSGG